jgi:hypothetical protein
LEVTLVTLRSLFVPGLILSLMLTDQALAPSAPPEKPEKKSPPWELARAKVEAAGKACRAIAHEYLEGKATAEQVHQWSRRWLGAARDASNKKSSQIEALEAHLERMRELEKAAQAKFEGKRGPASDVWAAEYHRLDAELELSRTKTSR